MNHPIEITSPRDGDVLNRNDGTETPEGLRIRVEGRTAAPGVTVNGTPCIVEQDRFHCDITLTDRRQSIIAQYGEAQHEIGVWWNRGSKPRYRFSVDDNIEFLKDLGTEPDRYPSLFDHWYLKFWSEMHETYGTKVHLNIYYQTDGFDLTQMPDKWKEEWQANAHWLHLSFHALQDKPDRPYRNAVYTQIAHDYDLVCGHIRRFAGNEVLSTTTTTHWAECPKAAIGALRDRGIEQLVGLFDIQNGECTTGYYHDLAQCAYCDQRGAWYDRETGLFFVRCTSVVNLLEVEEVVPFLNRRTATPHTSEMVELLIHEQYFRRELSYYQPTVLDKVRAAIRWVHERGHEPVFWSDGFLGTP
ncbi:MAG: hypothetical protein IT364_01460 [Candidatus Hydrogenedentes bacterium]|nr:hypothetical protein [Candidatus Hydrogenedentota bacterium]